MRLSGSIFTFGVSSGGDFNIAWEPILVLFTTATAANTRLTTLAHPARWACGPDRDADGIADGLASQVEMMTESVH